MPKSRNRKKKSTGRSTSHKSSTGFSPLSSKKPVGLLYREVKKETILETPTSCIFVFNPEIIAGYEHFIEGLCEAVKESQIVLNYDFGCAEFSEQQQYVNDKIAGGKLPYSISVSNTSTSEKEKGYFEDRHTEKAELEIEDLEEDEQVVVIQNFNSPEAKLLYCALDKESLWRSSLKAVGIPPCDEWKGEEGQKRQREQMSEEAQLREKFNNKFAFKSTLKKLLDGFSKGIAAGAELVIGEDQPGKDPLKVVIKSYDQLLEDCENVTMEIFFLHKENKQEGLFMNTSKLWGFFWLEFGEGRYFMHRNGIGPILLKIGTQLVEVEEHLSGWMQQIEEDYIPLLNLKTKK